MEMTRLMMYIMTLRPLSRLPSVNNSCSSSSLVLVRIVSSATKNAFLRPLPLSDWCLDLNYLSLTALTISQ